MSQVLPQDDDQRLMLNLPPAGGQAVNYGYTPNGMAMPSSMGMPNLNLQAPEFGIVDPTYLAQLEILNQGGGSYMPAAAPAALMGLLGSGLESQNQFLGNAPMVADYRAYIPSRGSNANLNRSIAVGGSGGGGGGDYYYGGDGRGGSDLYTYNEQLDAQGGGSRAPSWVGLPADMIRDSGDNSFDPQRDDQSGGSRGESWQSVPADMRGDSASDSASKGCVIATHAVSSGAFTPREKRQAELWCIKKLHNKWWGEAIRRGYRYHGNASIKGGKAATHYQEFRDFVDFGSGKRRNAKTAFTFAWRSVQFFFTGLLVKS
jgi:hypothetical protein